jgi:hypothetical protein
MGRLIPELPDQKVLGKCHIRWFLSVPSMTHDGHHPCSVMVGNANYSILCREEYFLEMEISALRHSDLVTDDDTLPA